MSDQGEISNGRAVDFGLIETLLWTQTEGFSFYDEHLARLEHSSRCLGFRFDKAAVEDALTRAVAFPQDHAAFGRNRLKAENAIDSKSMERAQREKPVPTSSQRAVAPRLRVRLVLSKDGRIETSVMAIEPMAADALWRVAAARRRFSSSDPLLRHKTTRRENYETELAEAQSRIGADEIIFLNEHGELCEGARTNLFVARDGILLTPPLACGLLPGVLRAHLLENGRAKESVLHVADLADGAEFYMGNSVRGLVRAQWLGEA